MSRPHTRDDFDSGLDVEFPLAYEGEVWYQGWDIPGHWAIDAQGRTFADFGAHGCCMTSVPLSRVISELESNSGHAEAQGLRQLCGRKPAFPGWMRTAISEGWTPPPGFRREDYE